MLFEHMDKVVHFIMYAGLSFIIWYEFFRSHTKGMNIKLFLAIFLIPALFSGFMEYMQSKATDYRSGDIMDLLFNVLGIIFSNIICLTLFSYLLGKRKSENN
jgi:VanZ family protein